MNVTSNITGQVEEAIAKSQAVVTELTRQLNDATQAHQKNLGMRTLLQQLTSQGAVIEVQMEAPAPLTDATLAPGQKLDGKLIEGDFGDSAKA